MNILLSLIILSFLAPDDALLNMGISRQTRQAVLVTTTSWESQSGTLRTYSRLHDRWTEIGSEIMVTIGQSGLGWGNGLHKEVMDGPKKIEGDGKAPAGIFKLGPAFGYYENFLPGSKLPYRHITERDYFIDDPQSRDYNQWVSLPENVTNNPQARWSSFERMKRKDNLYELGIVIRHNTDPVIKGRGSAIFFHVWRKHGAPTAGCTAMARDNLLALIQWLDPALEPRLVQVPFSEMNKIRMSEGR